MYASMLIGFFCAVVLKLDRLVVLFRLLVSFISISRWPYGVHHPWGHDSLGAVLFVFGCLSGYHLLDIDHEWVLIFFFKKRMLIVTFSR